MSLLRRIVPDAEAATGGQVARATGRSWWALKKTDGTILREWDPDLGSHTGHADWVRLGQLGKLKGAQSLRLFCPNGKLAQVERPDGQDATGLLFQFKSAVRHTRFNMGGQVIGTAQREVLAHVVGVIDGQDGHCVLFAWELVPEPQPPGDKPHVPPRPDAMNKEQPLWALKEQIQLWNEARQREADYLSSGEYVEYQRKLREWQQLPGNGRLVGPIVDNVNHMSYQQVGRLSADALGILEGVGR